MDATLTCVFNNREFRATFTLGQGGLELSVAPLLGSRPSLGLPSTIYREGEELRDNCRITPTVILLGLA